MNPTALLWSTGRSLSVQFAALVLLALVSFSISAAQLPARLAAGDDFPPEATLECRAADFGDGTPPLLTVPPKVFIEYSMPRSWVRVTLGKRVFEATSEGYKIGPKSWGSDIERRGFSINVVTGWSRGWTTFTLDDNRVDWKGYCEVSS